MGNLIRRYFKFKVFNTSIEDHVRRKSFRDEVR